MIDDTFADVATTDIAMEEGIMEDVSTADAMTDASLPMFVARERGIFLAGWCAGEVWLLRTRNHGEEREDPTKRRFQLCEAGGAHTLADAGVCVMSCLRRFIFVSVKKGSSKAPLQVFDVTQAGSLSNVSSGKELAVPCEADNKQRGLCAIAPLLDAKEGRLMVLLGCGRGIGTGHIWVLDESYCAVGHSAVRYLGKIRVSGSTILAMRFSRCRRFLVTVSNDDKVAQCWALPSLNLLLDPSVAPFDIKAGLSERVAFDKLALAFVLGDDEAGAAHLVEDVEKALNMVPDPAVWVTAQMRQTGGKSAEEWDLLFPPRLIDPLAYDGSVDALGRPHGFGAQAFEDDPNRVYEGDWKHGVRYGKGQLVDLRSGAVLYSGGWKNGVRHGFGMEVRSTTGERFDGWFRDDKRHGIGALVMSNKDSLLRANNKAWRKRVRVTGFFKAGKRHGLSWTTFPKECPAVPFAVTPGSIQHLLPIRCVMQYGEGEFFRESGYHRVDGVPLSDADRDLFNFAPAKKRKSFSVHADGHWAHPECWACLEEEVIENDEMLVCGNPACQMRVHTSCLGHANARRLFLVEQCGRWYCNDIDEQEMEMLRTFQPPAGLWFCPLPNCQDLGEKALSGTGIETTVMQQQTVAENTAATPTKGHNMSRKQQTKKKKKQKKRRMNANSENSIPNIDVDAMLRVLTPLAPLPDVHEEEPSFADLKRGCPPDSRLQYFDYLGNAWLVETEADLEEARECASISKQDLLHLYPTV